MEIGQEGSRPTPQPTRVSARASKRGGAEAPALARVVRFGAVVGAAGALATARRASRRSRRPKDAPAGLAAFEDAPCFLEVVGEVALLVLAVCMTGFWASPLIFSLLTAITVAGFARGFGFAVRIGVLASLNY